MNIFKPLLVAATLVGTCTAANATVPVFQGGVGGVAPGLVLLTDFDTAAGLSGTFQLKTLPNDSDGARPAFDPGSESYLSVLGGDTATLSFGPTSVISFDLGSVDDYNTLTLLFDTGGPETLIGTAICGGTPLCQGDGSQTNSDTNGRVTYTAAPGQMFVGITLASEQNSFEIDEFATAVPEASSWGMLAAGLGMVGFSARRVSRRKAATA